MIARVSLLSVLVTFPVLVACSERVEGDESAIAKLFATYDEMASNEDLEGWMSLLTEDIFWGAPNQPALIGKDSVLGRVWVMFSDYDMTHRGTLDEIRVADGWGIVSGTYDFLLVPNGSGDSIHEIGKIIYVVERDADGQWRIARAVWNANQPGAL